MSGESEDASAFNLEFIKKETKRFLRACRAGDSSALARVRARLPRLAALDDAAIASAIRLADAQHLVALEAGCANWADLKRHGDALEEFLAFTRGGAYARIVQSLDRFGPLSRVNVHAAAALGDRTALERHLDRDASLATAEHRGWPPLIYACASRLHRLTSRSAEGLLDCAELLLDRGVDPNTSTLGDGGEPISAARRAGFLFSGNFHVLTLLYARGARREPPVANHGHGAIDQKWRDVFEQFVKDYPQELIARAQAAAEEARRREPPPPASVFPDPRQSFRRTPAGGSMVQPPMWSAGMQAMHGLQGDDALALGMALFYPLPLVERCLTAGFDVSRRPRLARSLVAIATRAGRRDVRALLSTHGAPADDVTVTDEFIGACLSLDENAARAIRESNSGLEKSFDPADADILLRAIANNAARHVELMLTCGWPVDARGEGGATALHVAAWHGYPVIVDLVLARSASRTVRDRVFRQTPLEWVLHGSTHGRDAPEDYLAVLARLRS